MSGKHTVHALEAKDEEADEKIICEDLILISQKCVTSILCRQSVNPPHDGWVYILVLDSADCHLHDRLRVRGADSTQAGVSVHTGLQWPLSQ